MLSTKSLAVLASIKAELLSKNIVEEVPDSKALKPLKKKEAKKTIHRAREKSGVFQRACRNRSWWSPVYGREEK